VIARLHEAGFVAYLAGGCVRDALLGKQPKDYDVATNATPESVREVFGKSRTLAFGASFGVIGVLPPRDQSRTGEKVEPIEVATFRSDGEYSDGRRPDSVHYGDAQQDALRRDFTINGLFFDPLKDLIVDFVGGQEDLQAQVLRTIGSPTDRFGEDKLRMLRAVRFATTLGFRIDDATLQAIAEHSADIAIVSGERIGAEMRRVLNHEHAATGLQHLISCGLHHAVLPEIEAVDLTRFATLIQHAKPGSFPLALACLLGAAHGEDVVQSALQRITQRWKLSNEEVRLVDAALKHWRIVAEAHKLRWSKVQPLLIDRDAATIVQFASAVVTADDMDQAGVQLAREALTWSAVRLDPPALLTGDDLQELGVPVGPHYRQILQTIRDGQLDGEIRTREQAIQSIQGPTG
jgi:tRNA nucleotidyltransferase/poly(A) polymerase